MSGDQKLPEGFKPLWMELQEEFMSEPFSRVQEQRKREGRCLQCGELLEVRVTGMQDCKVCTDEAPIS